jgi:hypothetical protein
VRLPILTLLLLLGCRADSPDARRPAAGTRLANAIDDPATDGCHQTAGQRPDTTIQIGTPAADDWRRRVARGIEFECAIHQWLILRIVVAGDTIAPSLDSAAVFLAPDTERALQVLHRAQGDAEMPLPHHSDILRAIDVDADGWHDLLLGKFWGATGNYGYDVWRYDPRSRRFVADTLLSQLWNPSPVLGRSCVSTYSNSSVADDDMGVYCLHDGRWRLDSAETHTWLRDSQSIRHDVMSRRGDSLVRVHTDTKPDSM